HVSLQPYIKNWDLFRCTSCSDSEGIASYFGTCKVFNPYLTNPLPWSAGSGSYGWNACYIGSGYTDVATRTSGWAGVAMSAVGLTAETIMVAEITKLVNPGGVYPPPGAPGLTSGGTSGTGCGSDGLKWTNFAERHNQG